MDSNIRAAYIILVLTAIAGLSFAIIITPVPPTPADGATIHYTNVTINVTVDENATCSILRGGGGGSGFMQALNFTVPSGSTPADYQAMVVLNASSVGPDFNWASNCTDLNFTTARWVSLPFWVESCDPVAMNATIWVRVDANITPSRTLVYMHYNSTYYNLSNGTATFEFFDDFNDDSIDTSKWTGDTGQFTESGGYLSGSDNTYRLKSVQNFTGNYVYESRFYASSVDASGPCMGGWYTSSSSGYSVFLSAGSNQYWWITSDGSDTHSSPNAIYYLNQWVRLRLWATGSSSYASMTGESSGSDSMTVSNSGLDSDYLILGERGGDSYTGYSYTAQWDWVFVRKYNSVEPSVSFGSEESESPPMNVTNASGNTYAYGSLPVDNGDGAYNYSVSCTGALGNSNTTANRTLTLETSISITGVAARALYGDTSAYVTWNTDKDANSTVNYGTTTALGSTTEDAGLSALHNLTLTGLTPGALYYYNVTSCTAAGLCNTSDMYNFTSDATPPSITFVPPSPANGTVTAQTNFTFNVSLNENASLCILNMNLSAAPVAAPPLSAGNSHTCYLVSSGNSVCYGSNGDGESTSYTGGDAIMLSAGGGYTCYLLSNGNSTCNGLNDHGQTDPYTGGDAVYVSAGANTVCYVLTNGNSFCNGASSSQTYSGGDAIAVAAGYDTTCYLLSTGNSYCTGGNFSGQAVDYSGGDAIRIAQSKNYPSRACYVLSNGNGLCYGDLYYGHGPDPSLEYQYSDENAIDVASGGNTVCYLLSNGNSACYGDNSSGQATGYSGGDAVSVAVGSGYTCYALSSRNSVCYGDNSSGQSTGYSGGDLHSSGGSGSPAMNVTNADADTFATTLLTVSQGGTFAYNATCTDMNGNSNTTANRTLTVETSISITGVAARALYGDTSAYVTWNTDKDANSTVNYGTTTALGSTTEDAGLSALHNLTLTGLTPGALYYYNVTSCTAAGLCNTSDMYNFTSDGTPPSITFVPPTPADGETVSSPDVLFNVSLDENASSCTFRTNMSTGLPPPAPIGTTEAETCYLLSSGNSACFGLNYDGEGTPYTGSDAVAISAGGGWANGFTCYLLSSGNSTCYGYNDSGQTTGYGGGDAVAISSGNNYYSGFTCYILSSGNSVCYGYNSSGQSTGYSGGDAIAVSAGPYHTCYLLSSGNSICYGDNSSGQSTGYGGGDAVAVAAGYIHTCYLLSSGNSICYGDNSSGQSTGYGGGDAVVVASNVYNTCYLLSSGNSFCYGDNSSGQSTGYGGGDAVAVAAGYSHTCYALSIGNSVCYGDNTYGESTSYTGSDILLSGGGSGPVIMNVTNADADTFATAAFSLSQGGTYGYTVNCTDLNHNYNVTTERTFTLPAFVLMTNVTATTLPGETSALISWLTSLPANSTVDYGETSDLGSLASNASIVVIHRVTITGMAPRTPQYYNISSCTATGLCNTTGPYNFTTRAPPSITFVPPTPANGSVSNIQNVTFNVSLDQNVSECYLEINYSSSLWTNIRHLGIYGGLFNYNASMGAGGNASFNMLNRNPVAAGDNYLCYILSDGVSVCYGNNGSGQATGYSGGDAIAVSGGSAQPCYLLGNGNSVCYGANGDGRATNYTDGNAIAVSGGADQTCYLLNNGNSVCYGNNTCNGYCDGESTNYSDGNAIAVSAGTYVTCYLLNNGNSACYGKYYNGSGYAPMLNYTGGDAIAVSAGDNFACYVLSNGNSICQGHSLDFGTDPRSNPLWGYSGGNAIAVSAGAFHTCYLLSNGDSECYGDGFGESNDLGTAPYGGGDAVALSAGSFYTCYLLTTGNSVCYGDNSSGQLMNYLGGNISIPFQHRRLMELHNADTSTYANYTIVNIPQGTYGYNVTCTDLDGDSSRVGNRTFAVDVTPPLITFALPTPYDSSTITYINVTINVSVNKNVTSCLLNINNYGASLWTNITHLGVSGGRFDYNASMGVNNYSSFNMLNRNPIALGGTAPAGGHACYLLNSGNTTCIGVNYYGEASSYTGGNVVALSSGENHTCYLLGTGNSVCYGDNASGQHTDYNGGDAIALSAGYYHTCYLLSSGNSICYGLNYSGQTTSYNGSDAIAVSAGWYHTCYLLRNGTSLCRGLNNFGQGTRYADGDAIALSVGHDHTCYLLSSGNSACYGDNTLGQATNYSGGDAIAVSAGGEFTCYLLSNGNSTCYGAYNNASTFYAMPNYAGGDAIAISSAYNYVCYLRSNGNSFCYGNNYYGQASPYPLGNIRIPFSINTDQHTSLVMTVQDAGANTQAHYDLVNLLAGTYHYNVNCTDLVGNTNRTTNRTFTLVPDVTPPAVSFVPPTPGNGTTVYQHDVRINVSVDENASRCLLAFQPPLATSVSAGFIFTCYLLDNHNSACYGKYTDNDISQEFVMPNYTGGQAIALAANLDHICYLLSNNNSACYGWNGHGETTSYTGGDAVAIGPGDRSTCYLLSNGSSTCYGDSSCGGESPCIGSRGQSTSYTGGDAIAVSGGEYHTCYLLSNGNSTCYGSNLFGQSDPYTGGDAIALSASAGRTCYLLSNGNSVCHGWSFYGEGNSYSGADAIALSAGAEFTCYLRSNGNSICNGLNDLGQATAYTGGDAVALSAGYWHTCYLLSNHSSVCYGNHAYGQTTSYPPASPVIPLNVTNASAGTSALASIWLPVGKYLYGVQCADRNGNTNWTENRTLTVTLLPPSLAFVPPTPANGTEVNNSYVTFNVSANKNISWCALEINNTPAYQRPAINLSAGESHTCYVLDNGSSACYGETTCQGYTPCIGPAGPSTTYAGGDAISAATGWFHTCYLRSNGNSICYGDTSCGGESPCVGSLGQSTNYTGGDAIAVAASGINTCYLLNSGNSVCYGIFFDPGTFTFVSLPNYTGSDAIAVDTSPSSVCYLLSNGNSTCYGYGTTDYTGGDAIAVSDDQAICYLLRNGNSLCYGGMLGADTPYTGGDAIEVSTYQYVTCYLLNTGNSACYGYNGFGQVVNYTGGDAVGVSVGYHYTCYLLRNGSSWCNGLSSAATNYTAGAPTIMMNASTDTSATAFLFLPTGNYLYSAQCVDTDGFTNWTVNQVLTVNAPSPSITFIPPTPDDGQTVTTLAVPFNVSVDENVSTCDLIISSNASPILMAGGFGHVCYLLNNGNSACYGDDGSPQSTNYTGGGNVTAISAGIHQTCYLFSNGTSLCYGDNTYGQSTSYTGGDAIAVAAGGYHTCYLLSSGNSTCYGDNGDGQSTNYTGGDAIAVAAGLAHTCYLLNNGNSTCYGWNANGESDPYTGGDAIAVSAGRDHTCYLLSTGNSVCHGNNMEGESNPYGGGDAIALSAGYFHTCYVLSNGNSVCYGWNSSGESTGYNGGHALAVAASEQYTCYLLNGSSPVCYNRPDLEYNASFASHMDIRNADAATTASVMVHGLPDGIYNYSGSCVSSGGASNSTLNRTFILHADRIPPSINFTAPTPANATILHDNNVTMNVTVSENASACYLHIRDLNANITSSLWNNVRHLGLYGGEFNYNASMGVSNYSSYNALNQVPIAAGNGFTCYLLNTGDSACYGKYISGFTAVAMPSYGGGNAVALTAGNNHVCYVLSSGNSLCYGSNAYGQGTNYLGGNAIADSGGDWHTCYLLDNGDGVCYGDYNAGSLTSYIVTPLSANYSGGHAIAVASGDNHVCYLLSNGNSACYGRNDNGQATNYTGGDAIAVSAGNGFTCYLLPSGNSSCYGWNDFGRAINYIGGNALALSSGVWHTCYLLSNGNSHCNGASSDYLGGDAIAVSAGGYHTCYILSDGSSSCTGLNDYGQSTSYNGGGLRMPFLSSEDSSIPMYVYNAGANTTATLTLTNVSDGSYLYWTQCLDPSGNSNTTENRTLYVEMRVVIYNVSSTGLPGDTSAFITWNTDKDSNSTVKYGTSPALGGGHKVSNGTDERFHNLTLTGLTPRTAYYYNVTSCAPGGVCATSGPFTFFLETVPPALDYTNPTPDNGTITIHRNIIVNVSVDQNVSACSFSLGCAPLWDNIRHLGIYGGGFNYNASMGVSNYSSFNANNIRTVALGAYYACYLLSNGNSVCQGAGYSGETTNYTGGDAVSVAAGYYNTCYLRSNGNSACYGSGQENYAGGDAVAVSASGAHTCYLLSTGNSTCYGANDYGQATNYTGGDAIAVVATGVHTCYLLSSGNSRCYGYDYGQIVNHTGGNAIALAAGLYHTCYLLSSGNSVCYGENGYGQSINYSGGNAIGIAAGSWYTCYLLANGNSLCYGDDTYNQSTNYSGGDAVGISSGGFQTCYVLSNGGTACYGYGADVYADYAGLDVKLPFSAASISMSITNASANTAVVSSIANLKRNVTYTYGMVCTNQGGISNRTGIRNLVVASSVNVSSCLVINESGAYTLNTDLTGAPISIGGRMVCVAINASNVSLDCADRSITNDGTADAYGVYVFAPASNVEVSGCDVSGYLSGVALNQTPGGTVFGNTLHGNTGNGLAVYASSPSLSSNRYYNNSADLRVDGSGTIDMDRDVFSAPSGILENYTTLSISGTTAPGEAYSVAWASMPGALPANTLSFAQKFIAISALSGSPSISSVLLSWSNAEAASYNKSRFGLWEYNAGWSLLNSSPDTSANTLSLSGLDTSGTFGILQSNGTSPRPPPPPPPPHRPTNCSDTEQEVNGQCIAVSCSCGVVSNHQCIPYPCCQDSQCEAGQVCTDHTCVLPPGTCNSDSDCAPGESCTNHTCITKPPVTPVTPGAGNQTPSVPGGACSISDQCMPGQYCNAGLCSNVTGVCGQAVNHAWVTYACGPEPGCPLCPQGSLCNNHVCAPQYSISAPDTGFVGEGVKVSVMNGTGPCGLCNIIWTSPSGRTGSGTTDANGTYVIPLNEKGTYKASVAQDPTKSASVNALSKPSPIEGQPPLILLLSAVPSYLWLLLLLLIIIGLIIYRRLRSGKTTKPPSA